ncbi:conserved oligomeric Golgi complex component, COG2 [Teratosphaeria destructans]|uniref:Conserved oligomeric Golgi complex subunit 2 n=1 Tax=Teratosphaeria destructans TaxID=418781 RepID=A0A9W7VY58_9PEZI|nr:conserved oligomeric Golgi complex component, COG2 [Teratosphaeria destructans]
MSNFYLPSTSTTAASTPPPRDTKPRTYFSSPVHSPISEDDDDDDLPYPTELPRHDFLVPDFDPQTYLSSLRHRHQTLEDLRADLRQRSQLLNRELLDLVNGNYEEFLSLGATSRAARSGSRACGEVEGVRKAVGERQREVQALLGERRALSRDVGVGRALLEVEEGLGELETGLRVTEGDGTDDDDDDDDVEEDEEEDEGSLLLASMQITRLERQAQQYVRLERLVERLGSSHPFLLARRSRVDAVRKTLLLDLAAALRSAKGEGRSADVLRVVRLYGVLGAEGEGVRVAGG